MKNLDTESHVRGESLFIDDIPEPPDLLHAAVAFSPVANGRLTGLDLAAARRAPGVTAVFEGKDVPGENQIGGIILDEPLLAEDSVHFIGQPLAFVLARTRRQAWEAAALVSATIDELLPVTDAREAEAAGLLIAPSRTISAGDVDDAWKKCALTVEGTAETGAQEHLYLETQGAMAIPGEKGRVHIHSSTQAPTSVQRIAARVLAMPMNKIEVEVARLGGAFGGKEDQATPWAVMAAMGAKLTGRPVKLVLSRHEDLRVTGKRHPYSTDYRLGLDRDGRILAFEATMYQNSGAAADLSTAIMERSLFHAANAYRVPNARITGICCRTNLVPFTAFRGFGGPQAMFVIEAALDHAARELGAEPWELRRKNLLEEGQHFHYGMSAKGCRAVRTFDEAAERYNLARKVEAVRRFNSGDDLFKKGISVTPVCFGISFTNRFLNQAGALIHVYTDGTVSVNTGAVEMGQGVNVKLLKIAAVTLGISEDLVTVENTNTGKVANTSPTAASSGADMNGMATQIACAEIRSRLLRVAAKELARPVDGLSICDGEVRDGDEPTGLTWGNLVNAAYVKRVNLSAQAHYATPGLDYDKEKEHGTPFAYHVYGTAITEVTLDVTRGTFTVDRVSVVHDGGRSLDETIDRGQLEGALVQGIGWLTMEEVVFGDDGILRSGTLSTYKVPDILGVPEIESIFLEDADNPAAVMKSKAIGEPPFMYGMGAFFAVMDAIRAARPDLPEFATAPLTNERVLGMLLREVPR